MALTITIQNTELRIGDSVRLSQKIREGEKERVQHFEGMLIAIKGNHGERSITVRRIGAGGIGIEKIIPVDLPSLVGVRVIRHGQVRRGKLYFLRERVGKAALKIDEVVKPLEERPTKRVEKNADEPVAAEGSTSNKKTDKPARKARRAKSPRVSSAKKAR